MKSITPISFLMVLIFILSLTGCKEEEEYGSPLVEIITPAESNNDVHVYDCLNRELPEEGKVIDFSDGNMGFAMIDEIDRSVDKDCTISISQINGQNVLFATRPNLGDIRVGIDISSMLGDNLSECRSFSVDIGIVRDEFMSASGYVYTYTGEENNVTETAWAIIDNEMAAKTVTVELPEEGFVEGANNIFVVSILDDVGFYSNNPCNVFIDNIIAYDESGEAIELDSTVEMNAPERIFGKADWSNQLVEPSDTMEWKVEGVSVDAVYGDFNKYQLIDDSSFSDDKVITVYFTEMEEITEDMYYTPYLTMEISDYSSYDKYSYTKDIKNTRWQTINVYCVEMKDEQGNPIDDKGNYVNQTRTICQFTMQQIDEAVYASLYDSKLPEYNSALTDEQRADYYANWKSYIKFMGVNSMREWITEEWVGENGTHANNQYFVDHATFSINEVNCGEIAK